MNTAIAHPQATASARATSTPRYLIRRDGVVLDYHPALAARPGFRTADELPEAYLEQVRLAQARDVAAAQARAAQQQRLQEMAARREQERGQAAAQPDAAPRRRVRGGAG